MFVVFFLVDDLVLKDHAFLGEFNEGWVFARVRVSASLIVVVSQVRRANSGLWRHERRLINVSTIMESLHASVKSVGAGTPRTLTVPWSRMFLRVANSVNNGDIVQGRVHVQQNARIQAGVTRNSYREGRVQWFATVACVGDRLVEVRCRLVARSSVPTFLCFSWERVAREDSSHLRVTVTWFVVANRVHWDRVVRRFAWPEHVKWDSSNLAVTGDVLDQIPMLKVRVQHDDRAIVARDASTDIKHSEREQCHHVGQNRFVFGVIYTSLNVWDHGYHRGTRGH